MAVVVVLAHTNDNVSRTILQCIHELERKSAIKLSLSKRVFLAELNTVEQLMSILSRSETEIKILKQTEEDSLIERHVIIISKRTNDKLVYAKSYIFPENLPPGIVEKYQKEGPGDRQHHCFFGDLKPSEDFLKSAMNQKLELYSGYTKSYAKKKSQWKSKKPSC